MHTFYSFVWSLLYGTRSGTRAYEVGGAGQHTMTLKISLLLWRWAQRSPFPVPLLRRTLYLSSSVPIFGNDFTVVEECLHQTHRTSSEGTR
jgi:hypothetical protein